MSNIHPTPPGAYGAEPAQGDVSPAILGLLSRTAPWVTFLSVLDFLGFLLMLVGGLIWIGTVAFFTQGAARPPMPGSYIGFAFLYLASGVFYAVRSYYLFRYGASIRNLRSGGGELSLIEALGYQTSFWRFVGTGTIVLFVLYAFAFVGMWTLWPR